ncbi:MAG: hypothetical protein DBY04_06225 [Clostridiales bacterium]|nr:MAG: hypothetical protein DBY04_06225 [Clostridiales bacterium]
MNSKRIISLILSILMTLQVFAFQTPVNAMEGVNPTIQKSEGQKIGKRSEVFEFKNNEKPKLSWFTTRSRSLFGTRDVDLTKSEKVKIETTATGLDKGTFNWEAFGQNKKFQAWIEVAYAGEKDDQNRPIRQRVSDVFDISKAGTIETKIVVDASKTVDNYYIVTEYDKEPDSFSINAFFDEPTLTSDKETKSLTFELGVHQIVSTKITYNLIDEYGKAIDLKEAKEEKPADTDLENLGKLGNGTDDPVATFNLKNDGTEILWQEQELDEWDLVESSVTLSLAKNKITSGGIDYKISSTYDNIKGGTVTIKRQKDAVTPKDPKNPGDIPAGYARINLVADEIGNGIKGTFTKDNTTDTTRVVDVRAGKPYTAAKAEIEKQGKPFPLTSENKVDAGKTFKAWAPELSTLGTAADKENKTLNATYQTSKVEIIPYLPGEEVPTEDKDGLPIPTNYVTITFKSESETKGKVKIGDKEGETVFAKVKPGIDLSQKTEITTVPAQHYGFTQWKPVLGKAADGQIYTAYFVKSGEEIGEKDPIPDGWFKVTVSQDTESIQAGTVPTKYYPVKPGDKLAEGKFPAIADRANEGYKDPAWYVGSDKVEKPYEVVINSSMDFVARATELESHKITKDNGLKPVDFTAYKGDEMGEDFWKKGVKLEKANENLQKLLDAAKVTDESGRTTTEAGEKVGTLKVTFSDGSFIEVQNQKLTVIDTKVEIDYNKDSDKDANAPRHKDEVVKGKIKSDEALEGAKVEILDKDNKVIGITLAKADGSFIAGTRELQAGETIKVRVTLPKAGKASEPVEKTVKLNADRLKDLLPIAKTQKENFSKKQNAIIKEKLDKLNTAITTADPLVDAKGKATATDTAENQTAIDNAVKALEEALKALTANIPPTISGPKTHEIFVGEDLDLKALVEVTDGDGADDLVEFDGSKVKVEVKKVEEGKETSVTDLSTIKNTVGTYKVTYTAKDKSNAEVTHEMTLTVKPRTTSAIEVTTDPSNMKYLITEKNSKAKLDLTGMTLNLVDNLGKKTKVELTDPKVKFKVNDREIKNGGDLTLEDDVKFIEVEYTPEGSQTPLKAQTKGVLRVGPDYDKDGTDDRTQNFDPEKIEKLVVVKQPQLDYIAKDKSEADKVFKLNLEGMIVRMTDKAGKEKLAVVSDGKFVEYDDTTKEIKGLTATPAHGAKLTPETSATAKGDNGKTVKITGPNNSEAETDKLKVFYDANKDGNPDYGQEQKTPAPSAMARNVGENPKVTTVEGMATPGAVIKITNKDGTVLTTEPEKVVAGPDGKYTATVKPMLADGTDIKVTAKLGEMEESDPTPATVFDDKNDNKQPDKDEGFNIAKATDIKFVDQPDLTYLVKTKDTEVTFEGKDGKGKAIYLELSYKNGEKTESKIMTLEDLMKDNANISVTPANGTKDKIGNDPATLVGKNIEVKLKNVVEKQGATEDQKTVATATSTNKFAIEIDADGNGKADKDETTPAPTAKALNVGKDPQSTTITGKAEKGAKVVAMEGNVKVGETTADAQTGEYTINAIKEGAALPVDTKVNVTAQVGVKKVSDPTEAIVKADKDGNGVADNEENFDITKTAKIEMVSDPNKMDYLVTTQDGTVKFDATGMLVRLTDKTGKEKLYTAEELAKDTTNFTVAPANGADLTIEANHGKKVKVTLKNAPADMTTKEVETSRALSVKLDANNNGKPDDQEVFDITKATKVEIIKNPDKMDYLVSKKDGKASFETKGLLIRLTDASGKTATYTAEDLEKDGIKDKFTLSPAKDQKLGLTAEGKTNSMDFTVTVTGATKEEKPTVKADRKVTVQLDADGNGKADETETTATPTVTARNIGTDNKTTVEGTAPKGSTVTIKYTPQGGQETTKTVTATDGTYKLEIEPKLPVDTVVTVTAKDGEKKVSPEVKTQVFDDKDNDGKDDKSQNFDITKADKIEMVYDPAKMNYLVTKEDGTVKLETKGMVVKVTDNAGVEKKFTAEEIAKDAKNFTVEPANGAEIGLDKNEKPIKVTLNVESATKKEATTSNLSVKLDKDGNGVADDQEQFDIKKATKVEILQNPDKMKYSVTKKTDKTPFDAKGVIIRLTDASGKTATYNYDDIIKDENKGKFTLSPADKDEIGLKEDGSVNTIPFTVTVTGADTKPSVTAKENITVILDKDGNGVDDRTEQTPEPDVIARNIGKDPQKTTVEIETKPKAKVTIEYTDKEGHQQKIENLTAGEDGKLTQEITPKLKDGTDVKVTVQDGEKQPTEKTVKVFDDLDGDKIPDTKAGQTERPAALASNIGKKPEFTTITGEAEKGATVTAKVDNEVVGTATADSKTGKYTIQAKQNEKPINEGVKIDVTATLAPKAESLKQTVVVFNDTDGTGQPDSAKDFDVKKTTGMQVVASPDKMVYSDGDKLNLDGLKVLLTDVNGNQKIFTYNSKGNKEFTDAGLSVDLKQDTELSSKDYNAQTAKDGHNGRKLVVTLDTTDNTQVTEAIKDETPTALTVNKNQSAQPTDVVAANQGDATVTKVKGKATKGAEIKITDANGNSLPPEGTTIIADANGEFTADLNKLLNPGTKVFVTATEPGKSESPKSETTVIRDKDGNWKADTGAKLSTPVIDPIREKDEKVVVTAPTAEDKIQTIEVSDQNGKTVTLTKDPADTTGKTWKVDGSNPEVKVKEENGKIAIPVKGTLPLNDRDQIKVTFKDGENPANEAFDKAPVQKASQTPKVDPVYTGDKSVKIADPTAADPTAKTIKVKVGDNDSMTVEKQEDGSWKVKEDPNKEVKVEDGKIVVPLDPSAKKDDVIKVSTINDSGKASPEAKVTVEDKAATKKPTIDRANKDENSVSGTAAPNAEVTVTVTPKGGEPKTFTGKADGKGSYKVTTDPLVDGDTVVVKASEPGKADNTSDPKVVGVDTSKLKDSIDKAEDPTIGGKDGANLKPDENPVDKALKDALDKGKKVKEKGDNGDSNTDQKAVDKAKDNLDKAIAQKVADTAVDKAKDNPTPENIKDAQDKIDAIPGSKDPNANDYNPIKKDLQDKLDLIKIIKEAEDRLKQDDVTGANDTPKKPQEDIDKLKNTIQDGKDVLNNNEKGKFGEKTNEIEKAINILNQERIQVSFKAVTFGSQTLFLRTSVPGARITVSINGKIITKSKVRNKEGKLVDVDYVTTDAFGTYTLFFGNINEDGYDFTKGLSESDEIIVNATKDGYNPGEYTETIY